MHAPVIAATTGLALASTMRITVLSVGSALAFGVLNSRMSAPPEKSSFLPMMMIASTAGSSCARSMPATSAERTACARPFTGGLSRAITAAPLRVSYAVVIVTPVPR